MTTDTERRVPEHPGCICPAWGRDVRCPRWFAHAIEAGEPIRPRTSGEALRWLDVPADAEAAFELACERLREGT